MADPESRELDEARMCAWGEALGAELRGGDVVLLRGPMGAGKTTLVRAIARGLGVARPDRVRSPTFAVCMIHAGPIELAHVDLFRLGEADSAPLSTALVSGAAFESLGLEHEEFPGADRVLIVEWSELWADPPKQHIEIALSRPPGRGDVRCIVVDDRRDASVEQ